MGGRPVIDVLLALLKAALLPAAGIVGALAYAAWWLWRRPDLNDCWEN